MDDNTEEYDLPTAEEFAKEYCGPRTNLENQARDAAWVLYQELLKVKKGKPLYCKCEPEPETCTCCHKEEDQAKEESASKVKNDKIKKASYVAPAAVKQGKRTYRQFLRDQVRVIGMAGVIAMSTAAYSQSQAIYKNATIVYSAIAKELPLVTYVHDLMFGQQTASAKVLVQNAITTYTAVSPKAANNPIVAALSKSLQTEESPLRATPIKESDITTLSAADPSLPEVKSLLDVGKQLADKYNDTLIDPRRGYQPVVPPVINPSSTTVTDP